MRGEYRFRCERQGGGNGSPPHARGILQEQMAELGEKRITPACAGNTYLSHASLEYFEDHPRMRGEYSPGIAQLHCKLGSPPHARGIRFSSSLSTRPSRITPACAGNTYRGKC